MSFALQKHTKYWQRCLRSLLPTAYTASDSTRMLLACFTIAALDLLGADELTTDDRRQFRAWVLASQHPDGGFGGGPTHAFAPATHGLGTTGEANAAATLFALQLLALLADDPRDAFSGVDRNATLAWLRRLQRPDGCFGEFRPAVVDRSVPGNFTTVVAGGADMRYCYIAAMIRWMLRGDDEVTRGTAAWVDDIDVPALVAYLRRGQTYDGGIAESALHESHAGYAFCAVAALDLLQRTGATDTFTNGIADLPALLHWLSGRSFCHVPADDSDDDDNSDDDDDDNSDDDTAGPGHDGLVHAGPLAPDACIAFNGRCNKNADSCYTWWTLGSLHILRASNCAVPDPDATWDASRHFLLTQTQHMIGGFSKTPGGPPDIYHAYLGLASLATAGEPGLKPLDPAVSVSADTVRAIEAARQGLIDGLTAPGEQRRAALAALASSLYGK